jgi:hypothetical protein
MITENKSNVATTIKNQNKSKKFYVISKITKDQSINDKIEQVFNDPKEYLKTDSDVIIGKILKKLIKYIKIYLIL